MLVLSRKTEQRIRIGDEIEIIVLAIEGDHVKIGIQAPRHITVLRYELVQDVTDENRRAASAASSGGAIPASAMAGLGSLLGGIGRQASPAESAQAGAPGNAATPQSPTPARPSVRSPYPPRSGPPGGGAPRPRPTGGYRIGGPGQGPRGPRTPDAGASSGAPPRRPDTPSEPTP